MRIAEVRAITVTRTDFPFLHDARMLNPYGGSIGRRVSPPHGEAAENRHASP
jgi:hypothetical protein